MLILLHQVKTITPLDIPHDFHADRLASLLTYHSKISLQISLQSKISDSSVSFIVIALTSASTVSTVSAVVLLDDFKKVCQ